MQPPEPLDEWRTPPFEPTARGDNLYGRGACDDKGQLFARVSAAYRRGFGVSPVFVRSGGSIPVVNEFQEALGAPVVLMGFAPPDERIHAPNEKFHLPNFFKGAETCALFPQEAARVIPLKSTRSERIFETLSV